MFDFNRFPSVDIPRLESKRLLLRVVQKGDAPDVFDYASDAEVTQFLPIHPYVDIAEAYSFIQDLLLRAKKGGFYPWVLEHKESRKVIGLIDLSLDANHPRGQVGYALSRAFWGNGYMTEALSEVLRFAFSELKLARVQAYCHTNNHASFRVMERSGMQYEGTLRSFFSSKGNVFDAKMYSAIPEDFLV